MPREEGGCHIHHCFPLPELSTPRNYWYEASPPVVASQYTYVRACVRACGHVDTCVMRACVRAYIYIYIYMAKLDLTTEIDTLHLGIGQATRCVVSRLNV